MGNLYIGLVHYPVLSREGRTVATAITGLDIHDLARSAHTYGVRSYYVITPLASQREITERIRRYWLELQEFDPTHRAEALQHVIVVATLEDSLRQVTDEEGVRPLIIGTSARRWNQEQIGYEKLRQQIEQGREPVYLLFGTGWGLAPEVIERIDALLPPIVGPGEYNHLSVRAAAAITLDRLRGRREHDRSPSHAPED
jgi:hypothetical protein